MAFVKLDCGLLRSSLWVERDHRSLFVTALLMAEPFEVIEPMAQLEVRSLAPTGWTVPPGWYGLVRAAGVGIVRQDGMEYEPGLDALIVLGSPDPESRSQDFEGRRLVRVDGGYLALNYMKYRDHDHTAAERQRRLRARKKVREQADVTRDGADVTRDAPLLSRDVAQPSHIAEGREQKADTETTTTTTTTSEVFANAEHRTAYLAYRSTHRMPDGFDAGLRAVHQPPSGGAAYDWPTIGAALVEMRAASAEFRPVALRAFCRRLALAGGEPAAIKALGRKGGATGDGIDWTQPIPD